MSLRTPAEIAVDQTARFVEGALPKPPCHVLEVGCGSGDVAERLLRDGYGVTGIDTEPESVVTARQKGVDAVEADLLEFRKGPYDAVLFVRSFHHVERTMAAADKAHSLLRPGGLLVADEFAVERMDLETARWFYEMLSLLETAGVIAPDPEAETIASSQLDRWYTEHEENGPLQTGEDMLMALGSRFTLDRVESGPYLFRYVCDRVAPTHEGARVANWVYEVESMRIRQGTLRGVGLRVVGRRI